MRVCFDTNCFIRIFSRAPVFTRIRIALLRGRIVAIVSNEILFEYREMIERKSSVPWRNYQSLLASLESLGFIQNISPQFRFNLIVGDPDDNKYCDCAITGDADYVVSYDQHLNSLRNSGYKPQPITPDEFALLI